MQHATTRRRPRRRKKLDYRHWATMAYWSPAEGAALLVGVNPDVVDDPEFRDAVLFERFEKLQILASRASEVAAKNYSPREFIDWAQRSRVRVPAILRNAVFTTAGKTNLDGRERDSLLALIISMAMAKYNYDPTSERSSATKVIQQDVERKGFKSSDTTVLKYLKEGANLLNRRRQ